MRGSVVAIVLVVLTGSAWAGNAAGEADAAFALGNDAYAQRDYQGALARYFLSYRLVPNRNVLFNIARCYEALGRDEEAYRYWHDVSEEKDLSEQDQAEVGAALARLLPKVALLQVTSEPPGAEVFLDRVDLGSRGQTPRTVATSVGMHTVILRKQGHREAKVRLKAVLGQATKRHVELAEVVGEIEIAAEPEGASLKRSGTNELLGSVPGTFSLPLGQHLLVVEADGYLPSQLLVDVKPDVTTRVATKLVERPRPKGKVVVTANKERAQVRVNGKDYGATPAVIELLPGSYAIEVSAEDFDPYVTRVRVEETSDLKIRAELSYAAPTIEAASKTALTADEAPASVSFITRDEILAFGYQTLPEALRAVRGLFFNDDRIYSYVGVRGLLPAGDLNTRVLVLYDGHAFNDAWSGQGFLGREFDVDLGEVERIEVVRGPNSLVFGTGAVFGVINVVSRKGVGGQLIDGTVGAGGQRALKVRAAGQLANEVASLQVGAAGYFGLGAAETDFGEQGVVRGLDDERVIGVNARVVWNGFTLSGRWNQRRKQSPTPFDPTPLHMPGAWYTDARGYAQLQYEKEIGPVSLTGRVAYDGSRYRGLYPYDDEEGNRTAYTTLGSADWLTAEARATFALGRKNRLTAAFDTQVQFTGQVVNSDMLLPDTRWFVAGTIMDEWHVTRWLFLHAGARLDKYGDVKEWAVSPRGAVVLRPYTTGLTKLVVGRGFRAPTIYEQFWHDNNATSRAALNLKPERITTFELEHSHNFGPELRVTVAGFLNVVNDVIVTDQDALPEPLCGTAEAPVQCLVTVNGQQPVFGAGAEVQARWQPGRFTLVEAQYSFSSVTNTQSVAPQHLASLRGMVPIIDRRLRLAGQLVFQAARRIDERSGTFTSEAGFLDLGLSGRWGPVRYYAGVKNLFDTRSAVPVFSSAVPSVPEYGRSFWVELGATY